MSGSPSKGMSQKDEDRVDQERLTEPYTSHAAQTPTQTATNKMTKLHAVLVGSLLLAGGSSAMARPDADDTLTQIHRLPNEIIGAAELKPVFRFGRRLQDGVTLSGATLSDATLSDATLSGATLSDATLSGVQEDGLVVGKNKAEAAEAELKAAFEKADAITEAELKAKAELKAALEEARDARRKAVRDFEAKQVELKDKVREYQRAKAEVDLMMEEARRMAKGCEASKANFEEFFAKEREKEAKLTATGKAAVAEFEKAKRVVENLKGEEADLKAALKEARDARAKAGR